MKLSASSEKAPLVAPENLAPSILVTVLFFLWGVPNNLNDVLIRQFMKSFVLNRFQAGLVQSAFYLGYFLFALPAALFMSRRGYKAGILRGWCCSVSARFCSGLQPLLLNTLVSCSRSSRAGLRFSRRVESIYCSTRSSRPSEPAN